MKILIGHWGHEANTFAEEEATWENYTGRGPTFGEESISANENLPSFLGGIIRACRREGIEMIPTVAYTGACPILDRDCAERMLQTILPACREHKGEIDGVCLALHGAGVSHDSDDLETFVLEKVREILGPDIPITVPMDLHGNISERMTKISQGLFGIRKYPHTDKDAASDRALTCLARILRGEIKPRVGLCRLPLLIPIGSGLTAGEPFPEIETFMEKYVKENGLVDASFFHGFPYADVPSGGASVVVVAEKDAEKHARTIAKFIWERRHYFKINSLSPAEALDLAQKVEKEGFVVLNEMSDNPGGGCPGDGTHLLREMLKRDLPDSIFGYMVDPIAVEKIFQCRPGDTLDLTLGGRHEAIFGEPLELSGAKVLALSDGVFYHTTPNLKGLKCFMGKSARIQVGNVQIVIGSNRNQTFDDRPFAVTGADIGNFRYVA
ncbi:MAG: M81 family metallopeptidase, partial [Clostridia bacterium]|nr:M81 family metallopeptidase [Clostridia bacterium]